MELLKELMMLIVTVNSSAKMFPNNRKLSDKGFVKSSKILIGRRSGIG
jgi:hypothetical protein